jgi:hypothetical protein
MSKTMNSTKKFFVLALFGFSFILIAVVISGVPHIEGPPLWSMSANTSGNSTVYSTTYDENKVSESFGVTILTGPMKQNETGQTALRRIGADKPFEGYLWVNNQMAQDNDFLVFGLLDYQQIPFEFNHSGSVGVHHRIHLAPYEESVYPFVLPPMADGSHDFEIFLVMKPDIHSLDDSARLATDQALLGSRRINIIAGNTPGFSSPIINNYDGPTVSCGPAYVLNDGLLVTKKPCETKALLSSRAAPGSAYDYSINIAADNNYPVSVAVVPLLDYSQIPLAGNTKDRVAFFNLSAKEKLAVPANVILPPDDGLHELLVLWIPKPYDSLDEDAMSVREYRQWPWSEPGIRIGIDVRQGNQT